MFAPRLGLTGFLVALALAGNCSVALGAPVTAPTSTPPANEALAPIITTPTIVAVGRRAFSVTATVNPNGSAGSYRIDYGTTPSYGLISYETHFPAGTATLTVTIRVYGLSPGVTYYFRLAANNIAGGTVFGPGQMVTTTSSGRYRRGHHHRHRPAVRQ